MVLINRLGGVDWRTLMPVQAEEVLYSGECGEYVAWTLYDDGVLVIEGKGPICDYTSSQDVPWRDLNNRIKTVVVEEGVTAIGSYTFSGSMATRISLPAGLERINKAAIMGCYNLGMLTIPDTVTSIGDSVFYETSIGTILFMGDAPVIGKNVFSYSSLVIYYDAENSTWDQEITSAFGVACRPLDDIETCMALGSCGNSATWRLDRDGTLVIEGSGPMHQYETIPWQGYTNEIKHVIIKQGITTISYSAFAKCSNLLSASIADTVVEIGNNAFERCTNLASVALSGNISEIGDYAFCYCQSILSLSIPDSLTYIGMAAFAGCEKLDIMTLGSITSINEALFSGCENLQSVSLPDNVVIIGDYAFQNCASLTNIIIPSTVSRISYQAFDNCLNLETITFTGNAPQINAESFSNVSAVAYYPVDNDTWTTEVMVDYGGAIVWKNENGVVPMQQPILALKAPAVEFKDMVRINAFFTAENLDNVVEMGMITYIEEVDVWNVETADYVIPGATHVASSDSYYASSQGIHAKYLGDTVYLACYAKLSDGTYVYTKLAPYSPITYATNQLKNSTNTQLKQLVAAMLNYGAEAQLYFGHNVDTLANAGMTAEQLALPEAYRADMVGSVPAASATKQGAFVNNKGFTVRKPAISFEGAFCINYFFTPAYTPVDGITLYYWNEADFNAVDVLTVDNSTGSVAMEGSGIEQYRGDIEGIATKSLSEAMYVVAVYSDGTTTWTSGVLGYSIGAYCSNQSNAGSTIAALAEATAVYGYHAKAYFG